MKQNSSVYQLLEMIGIDTIIVIDVENYEIDDYNQEGKKYKQPWCVSLNKLEIDKNTGLFNIPL